MLPATATGTSRPVGIGHARERVPGRLDGCRRRSGAQGPPATRTVRTGIGDLSPAAGSERGRVLGFNVPQLLGYDTELLVLEMTVVQQPFVLDFAEVRLDFPIEFPDEVWTHWLEEKQEQFGERWPVVERVLWDFESLDIYLLDVSPRNIAFRD